MFYIEILIFVIIGALITYITFLSLTKKQNKKLKAEPQKVLVKSILKRALTDNVQFYFFPLLIFIFLLLTLLQWGDFNKALYYKKMFDEGEIIEVEAFRQNVISSLENIIRIYNSIENEGALRKPLWDNLTNLKEIFVKMFFAANPDSFEDSYYIDNWNEERYVDEGKFYSIIDIKVEKEGKNVKDFKYWFGMGKINQDSTRYVRFYIKSPNADNEWREISFELSNLLSFGDKESRINEVEARLKLRQIDFDKFGNATIKIEMMHEQEFPYFLFYFPTFRYKKGIGDFQLRIYFKHKLENFDVGYYDPKEMTIEWGNIYGKAKSPLIEKVETLIWKPEGKEIKNAWSYTLSFEYNTLRTILFKYQENYQR